jgi:hypothetical protein
MDRRSISDFGVLQYFMIYAEVCEVTAEKEVIAPHVQELAPYVHFHTKTSKVCSGGTRTCPGCAPLVQVVSGAATRPWPTIKAFLQRSPYENRDFARD